MLILRGETFKENNARSKRRKFIPYCQTMYCWAGTVLEQLFSMNGALYFTGGSDGKLHAIDLKTGKHRWKIISCPNQYNDSDDIFYGNVTGKDGKIFVRSGLHLYCYKVIQ